MQICAKVKPAVRFGSLSLSLSSSALQSNLALNSTPNSAHLQADREAADTSRARERRRPRRSGPTGWAWCSLRRRVCYATVRTCYTFRSALPICAPNLSGAVGRHLAAAAAAAAAAAQYSFSANVLIDSAELGVGSLLAGGREKSRTEQREREREREKGRKRQRRRRRRRETVSLGAPLA